jgi:hypothetical protein
MRAVEPRDPRGVKRIQQRAADQRRYTKARKLYTDRFEGSEIMRAMADHMGKQRLNFEELKELGHRLGELANLPRPGREEQRRRDLFVGWLNTHQLLFERCLWNLTAVPTTPEIPSCENDSLIDAWVSSFSEDDQTLDKRFD